MQLKPLRRPLALLLLSILAGVEGAAAELRLRTTDSVFREWGGPLHMTVIAPEVAASADVGESFAVHAGWSADIVSGASVAVVDAPAGAVDTITSATKLNDFRQVVGGGVAVKSGLTTLRGGYTYGFENDYRSHSLQLGASTELFQRNTILDLSYGRGFDSVCDLAQPRAKEAVDKQRLPSSAGCFGGADRDAPSLDLHTVQAGWTQAWSRLFTTQILGTVQILHGFQSNPYRAVWLGRTAAQEHHPDNRARYAVGMNARYWIEPLRGAAQLSIRGYRDTWNVRSVTAEAAYDQYVYEGLRIRGRARYYTQSAAAFYSDDYARAPRGQYFTGDRELSKMSSVTLGGAVQWAVPPNEEGDVLGVFSSLDLVFKLDAVFFSFPDFHYNSVGVPNNKAMIGTAGIEAAF